ncbi:MAG: replicative helicase loader/inhibitor [Clostridiaceae bacterium]|nr:replicative helicase loader/inhibitor [Clostridiaceae bacterium]
MTFAETGEIMDILAIAYPQFYNGRNAPDRGQAIALWGNIFEDDPLPVVAAAVKALIATEPSNYPPSIGAVKARIRQISQPRGMSEAEAWRLVEVAATNGQYGAEEEFRKLPATVQTLVKSPDQLRQWATMDADTFRTVIGSNFQRSYREVAKYEREMAMLPPDIKALADQMAKQLEGNTPKALEANK